MPKEKRTRISRRLLPWPALVLIVLVAFLWRWLMEVAAQREDMLPIPAGNYQPLLAPPHAGAGKEDPQALVQVEAFQMDRHPVTNRQYRDFLLNHPEWRKSQVTAVVADAHYLHSWLSDLEWGIHQHAEQPVTQVSWFAASAYCESMGKKLPSNDQWEYVLQDQGRDRERVQRRALAWYSQPHSESRQPVGGGANGFGVENLVGLVWEWTEDFSGFMVNLESRDQSSMNGNTCGGGSFGMRDAEDYATYLRYAFRASLKAAYTTSSLGFRCVKVEE